MTVSSNSKTRIEYSEALGINVSTSYTDILLIDSRKISDSVIVINNTGSNSATYIIYGTPKNGITPVITDSSWINLTDSGRNPSEYVHTTSVTIPAGKRFAETFSNKWGWVLIQANSDLGTTLDIYHRGSTL